MILRSEVLSGPKWVATKPSSLQARLQHARIVSRAAFVSCSRSAVRQSAANSSRVYAMRKSSGRVVIRIRVGLCHRGNASPTRRRLSTRSDPAPRRAPGEPPGSAFGIGARGAAAPAIGELAFHLLAARRAAPRWLRIRCAAATSSVDESCGRDRSPASSMTQSSGHVSLTGSSPAPPSRKSLRTTQGMAWFSSTWRACPMMALLSVV